MREAVDQAEQAAAHQQQAGDVERVAVGRLVVLEPQHRANRGDRREGEVDEQRPPPRRVGREDPAEQEPHRPARAGDAAVDRERLRALGRDGEGRGQQREHRRREQRPERALDRAGEDQHREVDRRATERGGAGEADQADHQRALAADDVADPAAEQQQAAERQRVGGDHPLPVRVGEAERVLRGGERDVDDGVVEDDHQLRDAQDREDPPAPFVIGLAVRDHCLGRWLRGDRSCHRCLRRARAFASALQRTGAVDGLRSWYVRWPGTPGPRSPRTGATRRCSGSRRPGPPGSDPC